MANATLIAVKHSLALLPVILLVVGCRVSGKAIETLDSIQESAEQVKATAKQVSIAVEPVPDMTKEARLALQEFYKAGSIVNYNLPQLFSRIDELVTKSAALIEQTGRTAAQLEKTAAQFEALAASYRGKTIEGAEADWVKSVKRYAWLALALLWFVPSPVAWLRNPKQRFGTLISVLLKRKA